MSEHAHCRAEVGQRVRSGKPITKTEWDSMQLNTYERRLLIPLLDAEAFAATVEHCLKNCARCEHPSTYEEAVIHTYMPEAMRRLHEARTRYSNLAKLYVYESALNNLPDDD